MTGAPRLVEISILVLTALAVLMILLTFFAKVSRELRHRIRKSYIRRIEPALDEFLAGGQLRPEIENLSLWERDFFLAPLLTERLSLLRGSDRERLQGLARRLGLVEKYLGNLRSRSRWRRAWAAENLGYLGGAAEVAPLAALLEDRDEVVQAVAARALARIGSPAAVEALARTLDDPSELTRLRVAENLERTGQPAVEPLIELLERDPADEDHHEGVVQACRILGHLRAREASPALARAARESESEDVRAQATLALGRIGDPEHLDAVFAATADGSWPVRAQAANALGLIGEPASLPRLQSLAGDEEWWVRLNACKALGNMGPAGEQALVEILRGPDRYARDRAAAILESNGATRRSARRLGEEGRRGERARALIEALVETGATRHLRNLAGELPEEQRRLLLEKLPENGEDA